jgi:hypothetical protein
LHDLGAFAAGPAPRPELCTFLTVQHKLLLKRAAEAPAALRKRMKQQAAQVGRHNPALDDLGRGLQCLFKGTEQHAALMCCTSARQLHQVPQA